MIESYLLDKFQAVGPALLPPTPELRAKAALAARINDLYITPIQVRAVTLAAGRGGLPCGTLQCCAPVTQQPVPAFPAGP